MLQFGRSVIRHLKTWNVEHGLFFLSILDPFTEWKWTAKRGRNDKTEYRTGVGWTNPSINDTHHVRYISDACVSHHWRSRMWSWMRTMPSRSVRVTSVQAEIFRRSRHNVYIHFRAYADLLFFGIIRQNKIKETKCFLIPPRDDRLKTWCFAKETQV